jgi:hypothetical protein
VGRYCIQRKPATSSATPAEINKNSNAGVFLQLRHRSPRPDITLENTVIRIFQAPSYVINLELPGGIVRLLAMKATNCLLTNCGNTPKAWAAASTTSHLRHYTLVQLRHAVLTFTNEKATAP